MIKKMLTAGLGLICLSGYAQTKKGSQMIGGGLGLNFSQENVKGDMTSAYTNTGKKNILNLSINPSLTFFLADNLAIGGMLHIDLANEKSKYGNSSTEYKKINPSIYIGPIARYYLGGNDKGKPFTEINFRIAVLNKRSEKYFSQFSGTNSEYTEKTRSSWSSGITLGYEHFLNQSLGVFATIGFDYTRFKKSQEQTFISPNPPYYAIIQHSVINLPINVGVAIHLTNIK